MNAYMPERHFTYDDRLGIHVPDLQENWESMSTEEQSAVLYFWELVRGRIPDRIMALEQEIVKLQHRLDHEENFAKVCALTWDVAERASRINDLHIYFRLNQDVAVKAHH